MWYNISNITPPTNTIINTKIDDSKGERNIQKLIWDGKLWWQEDKSSYVYYSPTHWEYPKVTNNYYPRKVFRYID